MAASTSVDGIELSERTAPDSPAYAAAARRTQLLGLLVTAIVLVIVWLMVAKPALWG